MLSFEDSAQAMHFTPQQLQTKYIIETDSQMNTQTESETVRK